METIESVRAKIAKNFKKPREKQAQNVPRETLQWTRINKYTEQSVCEKYTAGCYSIGRTEQGKTIWRFESWFTPQNKQLKTDMLSIEQARASCQDHAAALGALNEALKA